MKFLQREFIGFKRILFGLRIKVKQKTFNLRALCSQTQSIVENRGNVIEEHKFIQDKNKIVLKKVILSYILVK